MMSEGDTRETTHRRLALSIVDASERELIEKFLRCDRREAIEFLTSAAKGYRVNGDHYDSEARLYRAAAERLDQIIARLNNGVPASATVTVSTTVERVLGDAGLGPIASGPAAVIEHDDF